MGGLAGGGGGGELTTHTPRGGGLGRELGKEEDACKIKPSTSKKPSGKKRDGKCRFMRGAVRRTKDDLRGGKGGGGGVCVWGDLLADWRLQ